MAVLRVFSLALLTCTVALAGCLAGGEVYSATILQDLSPRALGAFSPAFDEEV